MVVRAKMDSGPDRLRPDMSGNVRPITGQQVMSDAQVATLEDFYWNTLSRGTKRFDFPIPRTGLTGEFRFTAPPHITPAKAKVDGSRQWFVDHKFEQMP